MAAGEQVGGGQLVGVCLTVHGQLPPVKNEAKSMLAPGHPQRPRVERLLDAARTAMADRPLLKGPIALELVVWAPDHERVPDASNMLGGIGDVLQRRATGADVDHLGSLADVACVEDDNDIHQISYRRSRSSVRGYELRLYELRAG